MGMANLIVLVAPALGPTFGGSVVSFASWRMILWITVPVTIFLLILGIFIIKQYTPTQHYDFDWLRFGVLALGMISLLMGFNIMGQPGVLIKFASYMVASAVLFGTFGWLSNTVTKHYSSYRSSNARCSYLVFCLIFCCNIQTLE